MRKFDIEAYIAGSLSQNELAQFNEEMRRNPDFAKQVAAQQKLVGHLRTQMIRRHVTKVLAEKPKDRIAGWVWWILGALLLAAGFFLWRERASDVPSVSTPTPSTPWQTDTLPKAPSEPVLEDSKPTIQKEKPTVHKPRPIAQGPMTISPSPNVRGQNEDDADWESLLEKIWSTEFPPANVQFGPKYMDAVTLVGNRDFINAFAKLENQERKQGINDTLSFLKGYCLLELREGAEALRYFDNLEEKQPTWKAQLQWYRGLGHLLLKDKKAVPAFKEIASTPAHPFKKRAEKALKLLK